MNIEEATEAGVQILHLLQDYHRAPAHREMLVDPILYAFLKGRFGSVTRQHHVPVYGSNKPKRIDFRVGGPNPSVMELAVRSPVGSGSLLGGPNTSELRKLSKVSETRARNRILLLIDLYAGHYTKEALKSSYDHIHAGPGKFKRCPVRVVYGHMNNRFNFSWSPYK